MNDLVVDGELAAFVVDDEHADTATAVVEGVGKAVEQAALVKDREALLDITSLGHGNNAAIVTDVKDAVLLEDRADHVLNNDRWAWVADEGGLLVQLLGEEVNTKVAVLASLGGGRDADDLARAALEDEEITDADVVAWDRDCVWSTHGWTTVNTLRGVAWGGDLDFAVTDSDVLLAFDGGAVVVTLVALEWVEDTVGSAVQTVTERVVVTVFVVVSHVNLVTATFGWSVDGAVFDSYAFVEADRLTLGSVSVRWVVAWVGGLVLPTTRSSVLLGEWGGAVSVVSLGDVDARVDVDLSGRSVTSWVLAVVLTVLNVELSVGVTLVRLAVAIWSKMSVTPVNGGWEEAP